MSTDENFMAAALDIAGRPEFTSPNPRVGAVVVRDGRIVSEGVHEGPGAPHAEVNALREIDVRDATLYVTLEPCVHHGRTPPCAPAVVAAQPARVVVAMEDPDERMRGRGVRALRDAGIEVSVGVLGSEARALNAAYAHQRRTGRAYLTLKLALSLDGRLAAADGSSRWITGPEARARVHARRVEADAVVVGSGTVLVDDPQLTARDVDAPRQPVRVVLDGTGRVPASARVFHGAEVIVATTESVAHEVQTAWKEAGAEVIVLPQSGGRPDVTALLEDLGRRHFVEVLCEGGARLATALLAAGLVDRLELYYGPVVLGAGGAEIGVLDVNSMTDARRWETLEVRRLGDDVLVVLQRDGS